MPKTQNDEAVTEMNETEPTQEENHEEPNVNKYNELVVESSDEEDEPLKEGDHKARVEKI